MGSRILATPSSPMVVSSPIVYAHRLAITLSTNLRARCADGPYRARARGGGSCGCDGLTVICLAWHVALAWLVSIALTFPFRFQSFV